MNKENKMGISFEVGQEVVVARYHHWYRVPYELAKVEKITKTQVTLSNGLRYTLSSLSEVGGGNYGSEIATQIDPYRLMPIEEAKRRNVEINQENYMKKLAIEFEKFSWKKCSLDDLKKIKEIVSKYQ